MVDFVFFNLIDSVVVKVVSSVLVFFFILIFTSLQESLIDLNIIVSQRILGVHQIVMCAHSSLVEVLLREAHQKGLSELNTGFKTQQMGWCNLIIFESISSLTRHFLFHF